MWVLDISNPAIVPFVAAKFVTFKLSTSIKSVTIFPLLINVLFPINIAPVAGSDNLPSAVNSSPVTLCLIEPPFNNQPCVFNRLPTNKPDVPNISIVAFWATNNCVATFINSLNKVHFVTSKEEPEL